MKFSVIIVEYDSWPLTRRCVEALRGALNTTGRTDAEIIVVDNDPGGSTESPHGIRVIRNQDNVGFARACNQGMAAATGELVILINPDAIIEKNFFELVEAFFEENQAAGIAGPRVLDGDGGVQLSARKEIGLASGLLGRTSLLTRLFPKSPLVKRHFPALSERSGPTSVDWVSGACMIARRGMLEEIGGLDERFFMYFEDTDLCRRARAAEWRVFYLPGICVTHEAGGSSRSGAKAVWRLHRSAFLYHRKHGPHGPLGVYSVGVMAGLCLRATVRLAATLPDVVGQKDSVAGR